MTQPRQKRKAPEPSEWARGIARRVGRSVRTLRNQQNLSAQALSVRCSEIGYPLARNAIANLENDRRDEVSVAEVIVLAEALRIPPVALLYPYPSSPEEEVEYLPNQFVDPWYALQMFTGELMRGPRGSSDEARLVDDNTAALRLARRHDEAATELARRKILLRQRLVLADDLGSPDQHDKTKDPDRWAAAAEAARDVDAARSIVDESQKSVRYWRDRLRAAGLMPPKRTDHIDELVIPEG